MEQILAQTIRRYPSISKMEKLFDLMGKLLNEIPVFELENLPVPEAARLSYETMCSAAQEAEL